MTMRKSSTAYQRTAILTIATTAWLAAFGLNHASAQSFQFAAIGDTGYSKKSEAEFDRMLAAMNKENLAFVIHVGDIEADPRPYMARPNAVTEPCTDDAFKNILAQFQKSAHPFVLTPGDNDWTDCHLLKGRQLDPIERLGKLREMFYPAGRSLGQKTMPVESQASDPKFSKFRENLAWTVNNVSFATMHIVGSNNNLGRTPEMDAEANERMAAAVAWLHKAFADAKAKNSAGLVLMTQANVGFETHWTPSLVGRYFRLFPGVTPPKELKPSGFNDILNAIAAEMESYDKPVLFVHGDTHIFHVSKPLVGKKTKRFVDNFTRLEVFGDPDSHWVRVMVDPANPGLFTIRPEIIPENRAK
jgi:predicted phosphodiesterase